jgi:hypothetical protein
MFCALLFYGETGFEKSRLRSLIVAKRKSVGDGGAATHKNNERSDIFLWEGSQILSSPHKIKSTNSPQLEFVQKI